MIQNILKPVSYTHLRAHETPEHLVCRLLLEKKKKKRGKTTSVELILQHPALQLTETQTDI